MSTTFRNLLSQLSNIDYSNIVEITEIEKEVYGALAQAPNDLTGLITFMQVQIMLGHCAKAKAIAYKIWEIGGELSPQLEQIYTNNLLDLGLLEMASVLLKPRFDSLDANMDFFYPVFEKFAFMSGNMSLLWRLESHHLSQGSLNWEALGGFLGAYSAAKCEHIFKTIQKIVLDNTKDFLCRYEYVFYSDRGFPEVEIFIYAQISQPDDKKLQQIIADKINGFWHSSGHKKLNNLIVTVRNITRHQRDDLDI